LISAILVASGSDASNSAGELIKAKVYLAFRFDRVVIVVTANVGGFLAPVFREAGGH